MTVHVVVLPVQSPSHFSKVYPSRGVAVSVTYVLVLYELAHSQAVQLIPAGAEVIVPPEVLTAVVRV